MQHYKFEQLKLKKKKTKTKTPNEHLKKKKNILRTVHTNVRDLAVQYYGTIRYKCEIKK